jgi:hypothetical protein
MPTFRTFWVIDPEEGATMALINVEHCSLGDSALQPRRLYPSSHEEFARRRTLLMASLALTPIIPREKQNINALLKQNKTLNLMSFLSLRMILFWLYGSNNGKG